MKITGEQLLAVVNALHGDPHFQTGTLLVDHWGEAMEALCREGEALDKIAMAALQSAVKRLSEPGRCMCDGCRARLIVLLGIATGLECADRIQAAEEMRKAVMR